MDLVGSDLSEAVHVELANKGSVVGVLEVLGQNISRHRGLMVKAKRQTILFPGQEGVFSALEYVPDLLDERGDTSLEGHSQV